VAELTTVIDDYIAHNNAHPKPFIWTKSAHDIIRKVRFGDNLRLLAPGHRFKAANCKPVRETLH
jgi:hypothetical protein